MNKKKMLGTLAMSLALMGYAAAAVEADPALHGRWVSDEMEAEVIFNNGYVEFFFYDLPVLRGTYTASANTITIRITELHGGFLSEIGGFLSEITEDEEIPWDFPSSWLTLSQIITILENKLEVMGIPTEDIPYYLDYLSAVFARFFHVLTETFEVGGNTLALTFLGREASTFTRVN